MGKKRIITIDLSKEESDSTKPARQIGGATPDKGKGSKKKSVFREKKVPAKGWSSSGRKKASKGEGRLADMGEKALKEAEEIKKKEEKAGKPEKVKKKKAAKPKKVRSRRYQSLKKTIKSGQFYPPEKAVALVVKSATAKFDESVDVDIVVKKEKLTGSVKLPHGTGKTQKIVVFDKKIEEKIKKGKIDFDLLIAKTVDMPKIAKYAKLLGPKGLMPNPKNRTISDNPAKTAKDLAVGGIHFKTEKKAPLIHMTIGKISFGEKKLTENLEALLNAVNPRLIKKSVLSSTMGPGMKLEI